MEKDDDVETLTRTFLEAMNLSLTPTVTAADDHVRVDLEGPDAYLLLERKAAVLEALQLLLGKVAESRIGRDARVVVDCGGYRRGREDQLVAAARRTAGEVRKNRRPIELDALNSYERRLVHLALKDEPGVTTRSTGEGPLRRIVICPD